MFWQFKQSIIFIVDKHMIKAWTIKACLHLTTHFAQYFVFQFYFHKNSLFKNSISTVRPKEKICLFPVSRPTLFFLVTLKFLLAFQKNEVLSHPTYPICDFFFISFATFVVIFFVSSLNTGPNRPLFIKYFGQITHLLCYLLNKGK